MFRKNFALRGAAVAALLSLTAFAQEEYSTSKPEFYAAVITVAEAAPEVSTTAPVNALMAPTLGARCRSGELSGKQCRFKWGAALRQYGTFLTVQHVMNRGTYKGTLQGPFFGDWANAVSKFRFSNFSDDDPFLVNYIGHPMMGAVTGRIAIQNDPMAADLEVGKNKRYWKSRAKAMAFAAVYSVQWELGPVSETSIGNLGSFEYASHANGKMTNGTGMVDLVATPALGTAWLVGEDAIDKYGIAKLERVSHNPAWLMGIQVLNPTRAVSNLLRFKAPWYRDSRPVRLRP